MSDNERAEIVRFLKPPWAIDGDAFGKVWIPLTTLQQFINVVNAQDAELTRLRAMDQEARRLATESEAHPTPSCCVEQVEAAAQMILAAGELESGR